MKTRSGGWEWLSAGRQGRWGRSTGCLPASCVYKAMVEPKARSRAVTVQALPGEPGRGRREGLASAPRTAPAPALAWGGDPPGSQPQPRNRPLSRRRTLSAVGSLQPIVRSWKPPPALSRLLRASPLRFRGGGGAARSVVFLWVRCLGSFTCPWPG